MALISNKNKDELVASHDQGLIKPRVELEQPPEGANMAGLLINAFKTHSRKVLLVDTASRRQWTGAELLDECGRLATGLVNQVHVKPSDIVMTICEHTGVEILAALGVMFAGGALFGTSPSDGYSEVEMLCRLAKPNVIIASSRQHDIAIKLRQNVAGMQDVKIVWLDKPIKHCDSGCIVAEDDEDSLNNNNISTTNNNNNYSLETSDSCWFESIIERDQVILFEDLTNGPLDMQLLESVANERIDAAQHMLTYMLTSGSTGRPKVVPSTHEELVYGLFSMITACKYPVNGRSCVLRMGPNEVVSGDLPLDHGAGLNTMFLALYLGAKYVVMPSYDEYSFWQGVSDYKITTSIASTTFGFRLFNRLKQLIDSKSPLIDRWDLSSLKYIACCGAKLAFVDLVRDVQKTYGHIHITQAYGCTEIGFISIVPPDESLNDEHLNSVGYLFPGLLAKVICEGSAQENNEICSNSSEQKHKNLGPMQQGELLVWAKSKFKGYKCHPDDDSAQIYANCHDSEGTFYKTGDKVHYDNEGRIYIHGRFKDTLTLMEDWKILPAELEEVINEHPLVQQSAVIGVPDPDLPGCHKPKAFCKLIGSSEAAMALKSQQIDPKLHERLTARDFGFICEHIYDFMASRTARPKHLTGGVRIVEEFPRNGVLNKIDRKILAQMD